MSLKDPNVSTPGRRKRVAIVLSNPAVSPITGWPVGFWWSELTHPWFLLAEKGYQLELFSEQGGRCEADAYSDPRDPSGYSAGDLITMGFVNTPSLMKALEETERVASLDASRFDAILVAGGQGPMITMERSPALQAKFVEFHEQGKLACALCHGTSILRYARLSSGELLVRGRTVTGFADVEEDAADEAVWAAGALPRGQHLQPWRIEDELRRLGANYVRSGTWRGFAVRDGNLITGQQNFSGLETAELLVATLGV